MSGWNIWKSISKKLSIFPEKMKKIWQSDWKNTVRKCMTVLQENIRNLAERFRERRHLLDEHLKKKRPEVYELVIQLRKKISDEQREQEKQ